MVDSAPVPPVVGTAIVLDTMERAKALTEGTEQNDPVDVEPVAVNDDMSDPAVTEYLEATAAEEAAEA